MSRFFEIQIGEKLWQSHNANRLQKKGFLKIELNAVLTGIDANANVLGSLKVWGLGLKEIFTGSDYMSQPVTVRVGMGKGLPFANPNNRGVAFTGMVDFRAFPQHTGLDQYLALQVKSGGQSKFPDYVTLEWNKGEKLSDVLFRSLKGVKVEIAIRDDLAMFDEASISGTHKARFTTVQGFSEFLNYYSKKIVAKTDYQGISVIAYQNGWLITDFTKPSEPKKLEFYDFIGQPTFQQQGVFDCELICRGDLQVGDYVAFPDRMQARLNQQAAVIPRDQITLKGAFVISQIAYNLNSRGNTARDWSMIVTVITVQNAA